MPPNGRSAGARHVRRQKPLEEDLLATGPLRTPSGKRKRQDEKDDDQQQSYVDSKSSNKVLRLGRELLEEENAADAAAIAATDRNSALEFRSPLADQDEDQDGAMQDDGEVWGDEDDETDEDDHLAPDDLQTFQRFLPEAREPLLEGGWEVGNNERNNDDSSGVNLADIILAKIAEHEAGQNPEHEPRPVDEEDVVISDKVIEVYSKVGAILSRYKSGPLPKPFKILPTIPNWEYILAHAEPEQWTSNACLAATRIFISAKPAVAQRFLEAVLLDRVRDDIRETKKLNVHLWNSLKKALYRPSAFFKGFLFPLVSSSCTLREAHILGGILTRVSIPVLHSAAALKGLCDIAAEQASQKTEGSGATNVLIRVLLEKKYGRGQSLGPTMTRMRSVTDFGCSPPVPGG
jgi:essential nuclear protein 1